jgi:O-antigen ligase
VATFGLLIVVAILAGMLLGARAVTLAGVGAAIVGAVISPHVGLFVLAFMGPLKQPDVLSAPGFNVLLAGAIMVGCVYRLPIDRPRIGIPVALFILLAFWSYVFVQQLPEMVGGYVGEESRRIAYQFFQLCALVGAAIGGGYVLSGRRPWWLLGSLVGATAVAALLTIASYDAVGGSPFAGLLATSDADASRAVGPFGNPNYFGEFLATAIVMAIGLTLVTNRVGVRAALVAIAVVAAVALALSLSRGAIVALLVGLGCLAFMKSRGLGLAFVALGVLGVGVLYPAFLEWRLGTASAMEIAALNASDSGRFDAVLAGPQLFLSSPLFGVGFGQYSVLSARITEGHIAIGSHNWYMSVLAEQGLVGAVLWALLLTTVFLHLRTRVPPARLIGLSVLATYAAGSMFTNQPSSFQTSVLPLLVVVAAMVARWGPDEDPGAVRLSGPTAGREQLARP